MPPPDGWTPLDRWSLRSLARGLLALWLASALDPAAVRAASIEATWAVEVGSWETPSNWLFDLPPAAAAFPNNDTFDFFRVSIDSGSALDAQVNLGAQVKVDRVQIGAADTLSISTGGRLDLAFDPARPGSGEIANDGTLSLAGSVGTQIFGATELRLVGSGRLLLGDHPFNGIGSSILSLDLTQEEGHTLSGGGSLDLSSGSAYVGSFDNRGLVEATGINALQIFGTTVNAGTMRALGSGGLEIWGLLNRGTVEAVASRIEVHSTAGSEVRVENRGTLALRSGSVFSYGLLPPSSSDPAIFNYGSFELSDSSRLSSTRSLRNEGIMSITSGSQLTAPGLVNAAGQLRISGSGTLVEVDHAGNAALLEVLDGASLKATTLGSGHTSADALVRVGQGAELDLLTASDSNLPSFEGRGLELDAGRVRSASHLSTERVTGNGEIVVSNPLRSWFADGMTSPGFDDIGAIDVEGNLSFGFNSIYRAELASDGTLVDHDRLTVTGSATLGQRMRFDLTLLDGFTAAPGLSFELLRASMLFGSGAPLLSHFTLPELGNRLYLEPALQVGPGMDRLSLDVLQLVEATWNGGNGSYESSAWSYDRPPLSNAFPANGGFDRFSVQIGGAASPSHVALGSSLEVDRLSVRSDGVLELADGIALGIFSETRRPESGVVANDGLIRLGASGGPGRLLAQRALRIEGSGRLELGDSIHSRIGGPGPGGRLDLDHGAGHTIRGAGTLALGTGVLRNQGTLEATGNNALRIESEIIENLGVVRSIGTGGLDTLNATWTNLGTLDVDSGVVSMLRMNQTGSGAVTRIGPGGSLAASAVSTTGPAFVFSNGTLQLDGGTLRATLGDARFTGGSTRVEGNGSLVLGSDSRLAAIVSGATLAPGTGGVGSIGVAGRLSIGTGGRLELELGQQGGANVSDHIDASGSLFLEQPGGVVLSLSDGFSPEPGTRFELARASSIALGNQVLSLRSAFTLPTFADDAFLEPMIVTGIRSSLELRTMQLIDARWNGGEGDYANPDAWSFSRAPMEAAIPSESFLDRFRVRIDSSSSASRVNLTSQVAIEALELAAASELAIADAAGIDLLRDPSRAGSGHVVNDGLIRIAETGRLRGANGFLSFSGSGVVELEGPGSVIEAAVLPMQIGSIENRFGHTLRGAGRISVPGRSPSLPGFLHNAGTIEANGGLLELTDALHNDGVVLVNGTAQLQLWNYLENAGRVEVTGGGDLVIPNFALLSNAGLLRASGAGSELRFNRIVNLARIEVLDGARFEVGVGGLFSEVSGDAVVHIGRDAEVQFAAGAIPIGGLYQLDGGTLRSAHSSMSLNDLRLEGRGDVRLAGADPLLYLSNGSVIAPGLDGAGNITIDASLRAYDGTRFELQLGGSAAGTQYDYVDVLGTSFLGGTISVTLLDPVAVESAYQPTPGAVFDLIRADAIEDLGFELLLPELLGGLAWQAGIVSDSGRELLRIQIVPEPGTTGLVFLGLLMLSRGRTRRRRAQEPTGSSAGC